MMSNLLKKRVSLFQRTEIYVDIFRRHAVNPDKNNDMDEQPAQKAG
jgi:hypothetical protein